METRKCIPCGLVKPIDEFPLDRGRKSGRHPYCKPCKAEFMRKAQARWKASHPEKVKRNNKAQNLRKKYGLSLEVYEELLDAQGGVCLICGAAPDPLSLAVDHCHDSTEIRGLLCNPCNLGVGHFRDRPELLEAAAAYLRSKRRTGHFATSAPR